MKKIICVSNEIEKIISPSIKNKRKLVTIHSGVDLNRFRETGSVLRETYNIPPDQLLIGNVAAIAPHKDYQTFLKTVLILTAKIKAKYFIIGDGPNRKEIEKEVVSLGLQNDVIMTGFRNDIEKILPELDIFLMTSKTEGLGTSILDAFLAGVPVVATNAGGIPEMVTNEMTGLLAPVQDQHKLAAQVLKLVEDEQLAAQLVENSKKKVKEFSKGEMARKTYKVYQEILD